MIRNVSLSITVEFWFFCDAKLALSFQIIRFLRKKLTFASLVFRFCLAEKQQHRNFVPQINKKKYEKENVDDGIRSDNDIGLRGTGVVFDTRFV